MTPRAARIFRTSALISIAILASGCGSAGPSTSSVVASTSSSSPTSTSSTTPVPTTVVPVLTLRFPAHLAAGELNPVGFTVDNGGAAQSVTVHLQVDGLTANTPTSTAPNEKVVVQRRNPASGSWSPLPVHFITLSSGGFADVATYQLALPAQAGVAERLRLVPGGVSRTTVHVSLDGPSFATVAHSATLPLVTPTLTASGPSSVAPGSSPEFDFTLTNPTGVDYSHVKLGVMAYGSTPKCATDPFSTLKWSDGGAWSTAPSDDLTSPVATISVNAGQTVQLRVEPDVPADLPRCLKKGQVAMMVWLPGGGSAVGGSGPRERPGFFVRQDSPFFSIG